MSGLELLFALLLVCIVVGIAVVVMQIKAQSGRFDAQSRELGQLQAQLASGGQTQDAVASELRDRLTNTHSSLEGFKIALQARQQVDDESRQSLRRLEAVIAGASTRGAAGENILEEAIRHLPPEMLARNVWINGKVVEFALRLPGGKQLPIDSKWTSSGPLDAISQPDLEPARRVQLSNQIEREVERRVKEVSQYIDPSCTTPWAVAAIPDAAYSVCRSAFAEAHRRNVVIVGYSMAMPYLLALYQLHLQFARSVDMENLQACLMDIERQVVALEGSLENKLQRAVVMLQNAYSEGKQVSARIRASTHSIQASEQIDPGPNLVLVESGSVASTADPRE